MDNRCYCIKFNNNLLCVFIVLKMAFARKTAPEQSSQNIFAVKSGPAISLAMRCLRAAGPSILETQGICTRTPESSSGLRSQRRFRIRTEIIYLLESLNTLDSPPELDDRFWPTGGISIPDIGQGQSWKFEKLVRAGSWEVHGVVLHLEDIFSPFLPIV